LCFLSHLHFQVSAQSDGGAEGVMDMAPGSGKKKLDMVVSLWSGHQCLSVCAFLLQVRWVIAYQCYALAADATEVLKYTSAMAHMRTCLEIAAGANSEKRRHALAIIYDELCRKEWNQRAARGKPPRPLWVLPSHCALFASSGDRGFDVNVASLTKDKDLLDRARVAFDSAAGAAKSMPIFPTCVVIVLLTRSLSEAEKKPLAEPATPRDGGAYGHAKKGAGKQGGKSSFAKSAWSKGHGKRKGGWNSNYGQSSWNSNYGKKGW